MKAALVLVDLQYDFIEREGLVPCSPDLIENTSRLVQICRNHSIPVFHSRTVVDPDGNNRMPHWVRDDYWACVEGTRGCLPPPELEALAGEHVYKKQYFSAFGEPALDKDLKQLGIHILYVAGLFTHGCVRSTVLDAYERGYDVRVVSDCVASTAPLHAQISIQYLDGRAAKFIHIRHVEQTLIVSRLPYANASNDCLPVACIDGAWLPAAGVATIERRNPSDWHQVLCRVALAGLQQIEAATRSARKAQHAWHSTAIQHRVEIIRRWGQLLRNREEELTRLLALEIGKPVTFGREEIHRAGKLVQAAADTCGEQGPKRYHRSKTVQSRHRALGVVGLISPWNNPVAIPIGKISPALVLGNTIVWKPAPQAPETSRLVMQTLLEAGLPAGVVNLVFGDARTGRHLIADSNINGITLTGSLDTGRMAASECALHLKPLQAELGGNNAAIVMEDCRLVDYIQGLAFSAYGFSGQRCTATRRFIVQRSIRDTFVEQMSAAMKNLQINAPQNPATHIGPLVSRSHRERVRAALQQATGNGADLLYGEGVPDDLAAGCWLKPSLLLSEDQDAVIVQTETFGPVAVVQLANEFDEALYLCNHVSQGLTASLFTRDPELQTTFLERAQAGILRINPTVLGVNAEAPFGGWKASGLGPPEHGIWDRVFYTRAQAVYGGMPSTCAGKPGF